MEYFNNVGYRKWSGGDSTSGGVLSNRASALDEFAIDPFWVLTKPADNRNPVFMPVLDLLLR
jgi:hypothetical protein